MTGDPLPPDDARVAAMVGPWQAVPGGWRVPLRSGAADQLWAGTIRVQGGRVTVQAAERARWGIRLGLLLWIAGWLVWLLRRR